MKERRAKKLQCRKGIMTQESRNMPDATAIFAKKAPDITKPAAIPSDESMKLGGKNAGGADKARNSNLSHR